MEMFNVDIRLMMLVLVLSVAGTRGDERECPSTTGMAGICVEECDTTSPNCNPGFKCCSNGCGHTCTDLRCPVGVPKTNGTTDLFCGRGVGRVDCPANYYCEIDPADRFAVCCSCTADKCPPPEVRDPCMEKKCESDEVCVAKDVQCVTAPCPPIAECEACTEDAKCPCKNKACGDDEVCVLKHVQCVSPPCNPEASCEHVCKLRVDPGPCEAAMPRFYYDLDDEKCRAFSYGGCDGNDNNFNTMDACEAKCDGVEKDSTDGGAVMRGTLWVFSVSTLLAIIMSY